MDEGLLPERACYDLFHCYRRTESQRAAERIVNDEISFTPGIGLYSTAWMEHLRRSFVEQVGAPSGDEVGARFNAFAPQGEKRELPLADALREIKMRWPILANCDDSTLEALLSLWPEIQVRRDSIFDAVVEIMHNVGPDLSRPSPIYRPVGTANELSPGTTSGRGQAITPTVKEIPLKPAPKRQVRERRSNYKKRTTIETTQGDLWG